MSLRRFALVVGLGALLIGLVFGLTSVKTDGRGGSETVSCGSALAPDKAKADRADSIQRIGSTLAGGASVFNRDSNLVEQCDDAIGSRSAFAWILVGLGVVALLGSFVVRSPNTVATGSSRPLKPATAKDTPDPLTPAADTGPQSGNVPTRIGDSSSPAASNSKLEATCSAPIPKPGSGPPNALNSLAARFSRPLVISRYKNVAAILTPLLFIWLLALAISPNYHEGWITISIGHQDLIVHEDGGGNNTVQAQVATNDRGSTMYSRSTPTALWNCLRASYAPLLDNTVNDWTFNPSAADYAACRSN